MKTPAKLALIDDDPAVRHLWIRMLSRHKAFSIGGVLADAESALAALQHDPPDIVLVDWKLPGPMDGIAFIHQFKICHPATRAVLITNHDLVELPLAALLARVDGCLLKPDSPAALPARLKAVLDGTCIYSAGVISRLQDQLAATHLPRPQPSFPGPELACPPAPAAAQLSATQVKILTRAAADGELRRKELAAEFGISPNTLDTHLRRAYRRLGVHRLGEAVRRLFSGPPPSPRPPVTG